MKYFLELGSSASGKPDGEALMRIVAIDECAVIRKVGNHYVVNGKIIDTIYDSSTAALLSLGDYHRPVIMPDGHIVIQAENVQGNCSCEPLLMWKARCEDATRDFLKKSEECHKLQTEVMALKHQIVDAHLEGVKYAIYEIFKEMDLSGSQVIRDSGGTDDMMCAAAAERIQSYYKMLEQEKEVEKENG